MLYAKLVRSDCDQKSNKPSREQNLCLNAVSKDEREDFALNIGFMIFFLIVMVLWLLYFKNIPICLSVIKQSITTPRFPKAGNTHTQYIWRCLEFLR